jgi:hypothetical protein
MKRIIEYFCKPQAERRLKRFKLENPYRMLPADDGGESYRMECIFCREECHIMSRFRHAPDCPAGKTEEAKFKATRKAEDK